LTLQTAQLKSRLNAAAAFYFNPAFVVEKPLMIPIAKARLKKVFYFASIYL